MSPRRDRDQDDDPERTTVHGMDDAEQRRPDDDDRGRTRAPRRRDDDDDERGRGRLAAIYAEIFGTVFAFRAAQADERPGYGTFRAQIMSMLSEARRQVEDEGLDRRGDAQLAVVALIDETVQAADWVGADQWQHEPLQMHYDGNYLAGEKFFDRLDALRPGADDDLMEVYFICLCAGMRGTYHDDKPELDRRKRKLYQQIRRTDPQEDNHLTEEAYGRQLERSLTRSRFPFWWVAPFVLGMAGLYVAYWLILNQQVATIVQHAG